MVRRALALGALASVITASSARADRRGYLERLAGAIRTGLDAAAASHGPTLEPPAPIKVTWKAVRLGSLDLGAPLVAMTGGDLDGDGRGELYAVTAREVVVLAIANQRVKELARTPFVGEAMVPAARDAIGSAVIDGGELVASASGWANELRVHWHGTGLTARAGGPGFLVCPGERLSMVPGRNHFGDVAAPVYAVRCTDRLVDSTGAPLRVRAALTANKLDVAVERCTSAPSRVCSLAARYELKDYGTAFELADVDHDGHPELIVSGSDAPGDPDAIKVFTLGGDEKKGLFRRAFAGGVVAITAIDGDGDGVAELVAAVRLAGATRVDLWRLD